MIEALAITILSIILAYEAGNGQFMFAIPLVSGTLVGLVLGDVTNAIKVAVPIQLIFIGAVGIGAATPPDATLGTIIAVTLALKGVEFEAAIALSVPIAFVALTINTFIRTVQTLTIHAIDRFAAKGNWTGVQLLHYGMGPVLLTIRNFIVVFPAVLYGGEAVQAIISVVPEFFVTGFTVAGRMLPALGFGMLINMIGIPHLMPFLFIGFIITAYLPISLLGVAVIGLCTALLYDHFNQKSKVGAGGSDTSSLLKD
jgi:mannose/fructose/N-acetylgalactosamine-specific phosphotransferase system component IIC